MGMMARSFHEIPRSKIKSRAKGGHHHLYNLQSWTQNTIRGSFEKQLTYCFNHFHHTPAVCRQTYRVFKLTCCILFSFVGKVQNLPTMGHSVTQRTKFSVIWRVASAGGVNDYGAEVSTYWRLNFTPHAEDQKFSPSSCGRATFLHGLTSMISNLTNDMS